MRVALVFAGPVSQGMFGGRFMLDTISTLLQAYDLYCQKKADFIFATGGKNIFMDDGSLSVAEAMKKWFIQRDISKKDLGYTSESTDTFGNIADAFPHIMEKNPTAIVAVSDQLHLERIKLIMEKYCQIHDISVDLEYVPSNYCPSGAGRIKENIYYHLTKRDATGQGFIWSILRWGRRKRRGV